MPISFEDFAGVRDRRALAVVAQEYMASLFEDVSTTRRQHYEAGFLKTYMIEANLGGRSSPGDERDHLIERLATLGGLSVTATQEPGFLVAQRHGESESDIYFIDAVDPRFWLVHTPTVTSRSDRAMQVNVHSIQGLDSAWLPSDFLQSAANDAVQIGVGTHFSDGLYVDDLEERTDFSMRLWGSIARDVTEALLGHERLRRYTAISSVRLRVNAAEDLTSNDTIYYSGKVTVNGNSFSAHSGLVSEVFRSTYKSAIQDRIEHGAAVTISEAGRFSGMPLYLSYSDAPESDIGPRLRALISGKRPFRFWGIIDETPNGRVRAIVSDLHLGGRFTISADDRGMQIYAYEGLCGNAIARWVTLFQQTVNATARLIDANGEYVFA